MKKLVFVLFAILLVSSVFGQTGGAEDQIKETIGTIEKNISTAREFTEADKWNFLGAQWKEFLLKNKAIASVDSFFTKINIVFVILFARSWNISLEMFFIFLLWIFTLISLIGYTNIFLVKSNIQRFFVALALTIVLAQVKLFYYISVGLNKLILYKSSSWWKFTIFVVIIAGFFIYLILNKEIAKLIKENNEKNKIMSLEEKTKKLEKFKEGIKSTS